jgi:glycosyltransferase involved in cell wall biosynthesis
VDGPARVARRIGVYVDASCEARADGLWVSPSSQGFLVFAKAVTAHLGPITLFGRSPVRGEALVPLRGSARDRVCTAGSYESLRDLRAVGRSSASGLRALWQGLRDVDVVWVFGPHPLAIALIVFAWIRRRRVVLGVRQDTMAYFRSRLPGWRWRPLLLPLTAMDRLFRRLGRRLPVTAVGPGIAAQYGAPRPGLLEMTVSLVTESDLRRRSPIPGPDRVPVELLSVGRIDVEKNPFLLVDVVAELERSSPGSYRLTWVGDGPLAAEVRRRADALGVGDRIDLTGFVPFGPALLDRYRSADLFVHTALTEGVPQVLLEAASAAVPMVATDVGGVAATVGHGAALLVPPGDGAALVAAIRRVSQDRQLRGQLADTALRLAAERTVEAESRRVATFLRDGTVETEPAVVVHQAADIEPIIDLRDGARPAAAEQVGPIPTQSSS